MTWFAPQSAGAFVEELSEGQPARLTRDVETLILRRLIENRPCPLCLAECGQMCVVFGGAPSLWRTHPLRLRLTRHERSNLVSWALRRRRAEQSEPASPA